MRASSKDGKTALALDEWITIGVLTAMVVSLALDLVPATYGVFGAMVAVMVLGVVEPEQALAGFSTTAPIAIAALYVVAGAVEKTGLLQPVVDTVMADRGGHRTRLARLVGPTAGASAVLANTPIVAMMVPAVTNWADRRSQPRSKYLIPLSYASILGGVVTVIGTSTNLLVSSILDRDGDPIAMFEIAKLGLPVAVAGITGIILFAPLVLPDRRNPAQIDREEVRDFVVSMVVASGGPLTNRSVEDAGLRHLKGVYLVEVRRGEERFAAVGPTFVLRDADTLTFVGRAADVVDLQRLRGLVSSEADHYLAVDEGGRHTFFEVVVGTDSPVTGRTIRDSGFRGRYQAAVVAVHRSGQRVAGKLGDIVLRAGDTLIVLAGPDFRARWGNRRDFLLVARLGGTSPTATRKAPLVLLALAAVVVVPASGLASLVEVALVVALALIGLGVLTVAEARAAIQLDVVVMIGAAFGLGAALQESGLAGRIADGIVDTLGSRGDLGAVLAVVLVTILLTELVTNSAAAVIAVPIALSVAERTDLEPRVLALAVAVAASCSFLTPIGYQTNTMVYGPGGYRASDYLRLGLPLTIIVVVTLTTATLIVA
jgi:di/tricarboxylate transporter